MRYLKQPPGSDSSVDVGDSSAGEQQPDVSASGAGAGVIISKARELNRISQTKYRKRLKVCSFGCLSVLSNAFVLSGDLSTACGSRHNVTQTSADCDLFSYCIASHCVAHIVCNTMAAPVVACAHRATHLTQAPTPSFAHNTYSVLHAAVATFCGCQVHVTATCTDKELLWLLGLHP